MADAERDLGGGTDAEIEDEQRQDGDLRRAVEQQDDRHEAALRANGCSPTASPTTSPITTESAKATASSQNVIRSAAGTPRVSNTASSDDEHRARAG